MLYKYYFVRPLHYQRPWPALAEALAVKPAVWSKIVVTSVLRLRLYYKILELRL